MLMSLKMLPSKYRFHQFNLFTSFDMRLQTQWMESNRPGSCMVLARFEKLFAGRTIPLPYVRHIIFQGSFRWI